MSEENKWKLLPSIEFPKFGFGAAAIRDKIYIAGGYSKDEWELSSAELYDIKLNKWSPLPDMEEKRPSCAVTSLHGKVYSIGENDGFRSSGEMFDPATNKWTPIPDMRKNRYGCATALFH